ncbi:metallopeptidase family protein [Synoicihabitans lomoniglobus]|uniref:Metallopeptidase family protein n=1 Tax=Synoicihabitans lomoniglobus TaxID=2909285 RepID=A0AAE9ZVE4_9BACT|nr:metallopeptidase family protein [Opitutaceae bacterium LMO-M01]WED63794.1 metallopeptidase family protein [Opitutaceae bacterium LMO-M01]
MTLNDLRKIAAAEISATIAELSPPLRPHAERIPVLCHDHPSPEILGAEFEPDILGLFVGPAHGDSIGDEVGPPTQILLFLSNLWDYAEHDRETFLDEVHITYLHELGHYFGWDEDDLAERDLD